MSFYNDSNASRKVGKREICELFLQKLRARGDPNIVVDDGLADAIREHFMSLPSRYEYFPSFPPIWMGRSPGGALAAPHGPGPLAPVIGTSIPLLCTGMPPM